MKSLVNYLNTRIHELQSKIDTSPDDTSQENDFIDECQLEGMILICKEVIETIARETMGGKQQTIAEKLAELFTSSPHSIEQTAEYLAKLGIIYNPVDHSGYSFEPHKIIFNDLSALLIRLPDETDWNDKNIVGLYNALSIAQNLAEVWEHYTIGETQEYLINCAGIYQFGPHAPDNNTEQTLLFADGSRLSVANWEEENLVGTYMPLPSA